MATSVHLKLFQITELVHQDVHECIILVVLMQKLLMLSNQTLSPGLEVHHCSAAGKEKVASKKMV